MGGIKKTLTIGGKAVPMEANGATFIIYQQAFNEDGLQKFMELTEGEDKGAVTFIQRLAYVMSGAYQKGVSFVDWSSQFGILDIPNASADILGIIESNVSANEEGETKNA